MLGLGLTLLFRAAKAAERGETPVYVDPDAEMALAGGGPDLTDEERADAEEDEEPKPRPKKKKKKKKPAAEVAEETETTGDPKDEAEDEEAPRNA